MCKATTGNNLKNNIHNWRLINASSTVQTWIKERVKLPFLNEPQSYFNNNHNVNEKHKSFITGEIEKLVQKGCLVECNTGYIPKCVSSIGSEMKALKQLKNRLNLMIILLLMI